MALNREFLASLRQTGVDELFASDDVVYLLDRELRLQGWNGAWDEFALANDGAAVLESFPLGTSVLQGMTEDVAAFYLERYREVLHTQRFFEHDFECPSPTTRRRYRQTAYPVGGGAGVVVTNHLMVAEPITEVEETFRVHRHVNGDGLLIQCCHCRKVRDFSRDNKWDWVPLLLESPHPETSHGFCPPCFRYYYADFLARRSGP